MNAPIPCRLLHVGYHKCASTFLQRAVFAAHPSIHLARSDAINRALNSLAGGHIGLDAAAVQSTIRDHLAAAAGRDSTAIVISHEQLSGDMYTGHNAKYLADACRAILAPDQVLVLFRNPYDYLYSAWSQYVREGGTLSLRHFLGRSSSPALDKQQTIFDKLRYDAYLDYLSALFGADNVHFLPYEDLREHGAETVAAICRIAGVDDGFVPSFAQRPQKSLGYAGNNAKRLINLFCETRHNSFPLQPVRAPLHGRIRRWIERFDRSADPPRARLQALVPEPVQAALRESNRRLAELIGRDLAALGYDV
jgi:hypothetical protein